MLLKHTFLLSSLLALAASSPVTSPSGVHHRCARSCARSCLARYNTCIETAAQQHIYRCDSSLIACCHTSSDRSAQESFAQHPLLDDDQPVCLPDDAQLGKCEVACKVSDTLLPNPDDCGSFYQCTHCDPVLQVCPEGLFFNPKLNVCDFPANVKCDAPCQEFAIKSET